MSNIDNKVQAYMDAETKNFLTKRAREKSISVSKLSSQILEDFAKNSGKEKAYKARIIGILEMILMSVYDKETTEGNAQTTRELLDYIKQEANKMYNQSTSISK